MYNIVTLLTEEPKKIEKIILIFLKLLVVLFVGNEIFEYQFSMKTSLDDIIPTNYTISRGIFFLMSLVIVWYIVWTVIADLIIGELIVWLLSRSPMKRETCMHFLDWFKVVEQKGHLKNSYIMPNKNVIMFQQMLNSYNEEDDQFIREGKARVQEYYVLSVVIYCTLLFSKDIELPTILIWFGAMMIANFLILAVLINKVHKYLINNLDALKKEFGFMAYAQMTKNALEQNPHISRNYNITGRWKALILTPKHDQSGLPEKIKIHPLYIWNEELGKEVMNDTIASKCRETERQSDDNTNILLICNAKISDEVSRLVDINPKLDYVECPEGDEERVYKRIEVMFYRISKTKNNLGIISASE